MSNKPKPVKSNVEKRTITYLDIWKSQAALSHLVNVKQQGKNGPEPLCASVSIKIARLAKMIRSEMDLLTPIHTGLVEKYGEENPETKRKSVQQGSIAYDSFMLEFTEALKQEIPWDLDLVKLPGDALIDPAIFIDMEPFIDIE